LAERIVVEAFLASEIRLTFGQTKHLLGGKEEGRNDAWIATLVPFVPELERAKAFMNLKQMEKQIVHICLHKVALSCLSAASILAKIPRALL
jgi:hypothetical protein